MKMKEKILKKYYKKKRKKFISAVIIDIIGLLSFIIPSLGEWGDVIWAPLSGFLIYLLFPNRKKMAFLGVLEEAMPFMDFIPTAYITWRQEYIKDKNETLSKFIYSEVSDQQLVDEVLNTIDINKEKFSD